MNPLQQILIEFEIHSVNGINSCFDRGVDPNGKINGKPLFFELVNMYTRGPLFKQCVKAFVDRGLQFDDKALLAVLLDDADTLNSLVNKNPSLLEKRYSFPCTFTPLLNTTLLHICAEYNHLSCAKILVNAGMEVNIRAGVDKKGFGGHTPIFHTVNQDANKSIDVLKYLIAEKVDLNITVKGLIWGEGYEWETFIPSVNPISYSMMGLLRQFQRTEQQIYEIVSLLIKAAYEIDYIPSNIPNKYLQPTR